MVDLARIVGVHCPTYLEPGYLEMLPRCYWVYRKLGAHLQVLSQRLLSPREAR